MKTTIEYQQKITLSRVLVTTCLFSVIGLAGCQQQEEGTAEQAGKKIDQAVEKGSQQLDTAKEALDQKANKAGEFIEESIDISKEKIEEAGQKMETAKESVAEKAETAGEYIDDSVITMKVKAALVKDPLLDASKIEVTTVDGVVKLSGTVDSTQSITRAVELAGRQEHVKSVATDLVLSTTETGDK